MRRLSGLALGLMLFAVPASFASAENEYGRIQYVLNGVLTGDAMIAEVNFDINQILVGDAAMHLRDCDADMPGYCIASDYMTFFRPDAPSERWQINGYAFRVAGSGYLIPSVSKPAVEVIESDQRTGNFKFYYNNDVGLVAWSLTYTTMKGEMDTCSYLSVGESPKIPRKLRRLRNNSCWLKLGVTKKWELVARTASRQAMSIM